MNLPANKTSTSISGPIQPIDRGLSDLVASYRNRIETDRGQAVIRGTVPTTEHRQAMSVRLDDVRRALRPVHMGDADKRAAAKAITQLLTAWVHAGRGDIRDTVTAYTAHLSDLPLFAIEDACRRVAKGYVDGLSPDFPPSAARLHQLGMEACALLKQEMAQIHEVLNAKAYHEPSADERERIAAGFQQLSAELSEGDIREDRRAVALEAHGNANRRLFEQECAAAGIDPKGGVSPSLLKHLGPPVTREKGEAA